MVYRVVFEEEFPQGDDCDDDQPLRNSAPDHQNARDQGDKLTDPENQLGNLQVGNLQPEHNHGVEQGASLGAFEFDAE